MLEFDRTEEKKIGPFFTEHTWQIRDEQQNVSANIKDSSRAGPNVTKSHCAAYLFGGGWCVLSTWVAGWAVLPDFAIVSFAASFLFAK